MTLKCPHCNSVLISNDDGKSPIGVFKCKGCDCIFRLIVVNNDANCLIKRKKIK